MFDGRLQARTGCARTGCERTAGALQACAGAARGVCGLCVWCLVRGLCGLGFVVRVVCAWCLHRVRAECMVCGGRCTRHVAGKPGKEKKRERERERNNAT